MDGTQIYPGRTIQTAMGQLTSHAIAFTLNTRWEDLPADIKHQAKRCLIDSLGALIAGSQTPVAGIIRKTALAQFGGDQATIIVGGQRVSAAGAALANGFFGNALDIDDGYRNVKGHPGACALPPVLAAAELAGGCSGRELLTAMVVAYELGIRVRTFEAATRLPNGHPRDTEAAQYSLAFPVAAALLDGEVGPRQVLPPRLHDPALLALLDRVSTEIAPEFEAEFPAKAPAEVIVETTTGEIYRSGRIEALWEPPGTLPSDAELEAKFSWLTGPVIGKVGAQRLVEQIWSADQWTSIDPIFDGCRTAAG
jgi:2-methylcitrate dehydratase PrpD